MADVRTFLLGTNTVQILVELAHFTTKIWKKLVWKTGSANFVGKLRSERPRNLERPKKMKKLIRQILDDCQEDLQTGRTKISARRKRKISLNLLGMARRAEAEPQGVSPVPPSKLLKRN
jgi:hypothetical protein